MRFSGAINGKSGGSRKHDPIESRPAYIVNSYVGRDTSLFGLLATLLASLGLSGVVAFTVARRTREIGIRMALGAEPSDILRHVVSPMAFLVTAGMAVGLAAAYGLSRLVGSMLFEVASADPPAFAGACFLLGAVAAVAAYLPAQRATQVDPVVALRYE